jgi:hypothetical protein
MADKDTPIEQIVAGNGAADRANALFDAASPAMLYGRDDAATAGLNWGYIGGRWGGAAIASATLALSANATNYVVVKISDGTVSVSTSNTHWNDTTTYARAYEVITGASTVTDYQDNRAGPYGTINAAATAQSPVGLHAVYVSAGAIAPSFTGGCATLATIASGANKPDIVTLDFDKDTVEYAQFGVVMPKSWNEGTLTAEVLWSHTTTTVNFGVVWQVQAVAVSDNEAIAASYGTPQQVADTGGTADRLYHSAATPAITVGGSPAAEDMVFFRVSRLATDGSDTLAIDARLHGIVLKISTDQATDA